MFFKKLKKARKELKSSQRMLDEEFVKAIEVDCNNERIAIAIRKVMSDICGVPKEHISPDTKFLLIADAMKSGFVRGWDQMGFLLRLVKELKLKIILPRDVLSSLYSSDLDTVAFKTVLLEILNKMEIKE